MDCVRVSVVALLFMMQPASAQVNLLDGPDSRPKTLDDIEKKKAQEKAYKESLKKIPEQKAANDPWGDVRNAGTPASGNPRQKSR